MEFYGILIYYILRLLNNGILGYKVDFFWENILMKINN